MFLTFLSVVVKQYNKFYYVQKNLINYFKIKFVNT